MTPPPLRRLDHVSLNVADRARSIAWYRDAFGLEARNEQTDADEPVFLGDFGACIALFQAETVSPPRERESTGLRHVAFMLETSGELDDAQAHLDGLGASYRPQHHGNARSVYLTDPDGHVVELTTYDV